MFGLRVFILISWLAFWTYWFIAAIHTKRTIYRGGGAFIGLRLGIAAIILFLIKTHHIHSDFWSSVFAKDNLPTSNSVLAFVGTALFVSGLLFAIWARLNLGRNWGMPMATKKDPDLITSGPYHYVRHPIYTGVICAALGTTLAVGLPWLVVFIIFTAYFTFSAFREEKYLEKQFGSSYTKYKQHSKMLIPFIL